MEENNKRVLIMGLTPPLEGGSQRHIYEISSRIKDSTVLTQRGSACKNPVALTSTLENGFLTNISFFLSSLIYSLFLLITPKKKYDIIHIHENLLYLLAPFLKLRYEVIITVHGIVGFKFFENKFLWFFFRTSLKSAQKVISVSLADKPILEGILGSVKYIPNGVNLETYKDISPKIKKQITFASRIHEQKGIEYLLQAFHGISRKFPDYKLQIIGNTNTPLYNILKNKYKNKKIIWRGFISDRRELFTALASSEIIAAPSLWEALPWPALLEGLGSGRPVVASDLNGMRLIFKDKENILLIPPKNPKALSHALTYLIKNKTKAKEQGKAGKKLSEKYTWQNIAKEIHKFYNAPISSD
jgi:glycosyltransferase involved in cell wall biosynthesis